MKQLVLGGAVQSAPQNNRQTGGPNGRLPQHGGGGGNGNGGRPKRRRKNPLRGIIHLGHMDVPMLTITLLILLFGLVMLFSASYPSGYLRRGQNSFAFIKPQIEYAIIGLAGMLGASLVDYHFLKKFAWPLMAVTMILLFIVLLLPAKNGAHRWFWTNYENEQGFQPSEIAKFALILVFARMVSANQHRMKTFKYGFVPFMLVLGMMALLLVLEPHLSCTILVLGIGLCMMFAGGASIRWFAIGAAIVVGGAYLAFTYFPQLIPSYAYERVATWQDPFAVDPNDAHQTIQALIAVGSGGFFGKGIGHSVQKFLYLPEVYNDYIYAVVCEELGMIGGIAVMVFFVALLIRGLYIAVRAKDKFGSMLVVGISVQIALQAFLHIAVNLNAIPSTGISLPFFSFGGTSLCMLMGQVGVVLSVSRQANMKLARGEGADGPAEEPFAVDEAGALDMQDDAREVV